MRCLIFKDCLERIGCTYQEFEEVSEVSKKNEKVNEDIFSQIDGAAVVESDMPN